MALQPNLTTLRHLNGEHNRWCQKRCDGVIRCKFTGEQIKLVVN